MILFEDMLIMFIELTQKKLWGFCKDANVSVGSPKAGNTTIQCNGIKRGFIVIWHLLKKLYKKDTQPNNCNN